MEFSDETIKKFIAAYEQAHEEKLAREEAIVMFGKLVRLYRVLLRPLPQQGEQPMEPR